jgi:hypothetical protein
MKKTPGKQGFVNATKHLCDKLTKMPWFMALWDEWPIIVRKLPPDYMEKDFIHDMGRMKEVIQKYELKPAMEIGKITQVFELLAISIIQRHLLPGDYTEASNFIIDCVVNALFL